MADKNSGWKCTHSASTTSTSNTSVTIKVTCYWKNNGWTYDINYVSAWVYCKGSSKQVKNSGSVNADSSTTQQVSMGSASFTINKTTATQSASCYGKITTNSSYVKGTKSSSATSISIPAKPSYKITYNANGGSGAPGQQTKWYGTNITLSSTRPTRTGHTFVRWNTNTSNTGTAYNPGATYSSNANLTLYAIWKANTYTVSYNANGGSGAPGSQTKTYGVNLTLSGTRPTRTNYNFLGWSTSANGSISYQPGSTYTNNSSVTLYAIWQLAYKAPRIMNFNVSRCTSDGTVTEDGTYIKVNFNWSSDRAITKIGSQWRYGSASNWTEYQAISASGTSGSVNQTLGGNWDTEKAYQFRVYVQDSGGTSYSAALTIGSAIYPIDVKSGGHGIAFGKVAEEEDIADFGWIVNFKKGIKYYGQNTIASTAADTTANWGLYPNTLHFYSQTGLLNNQPSQWGWLLNLGNNSEIHQLWTTQASGTMYHRGGNSAGWSGSWRAIVDASNYSTYITSLAAGTVVGGFRFSSEWMGLYANQNNANSQASRKGWIGFNGGNNFNLYNEAGGNVFINVGLRLTGNIADDGNYGLTLGVNNNADMVQVYQAGGTTSGIKRIQPVVDGELYCGVSSNRWKAVYAQTGSIQTSDRNQKKDINLLDDRYEQLFYKLKPVFYKFKDPKSDRVHIGYIAQDVEESMIEVGLTDMDFGGFCKDIKERLVKIDPKTRENIYETVYDDDGNPEYDYALRYEEFIALNTHMIQKAHEKIQSQQKEINDLKKQIQDLTEFILAMSKKEE